MAYVPMALILLHSFFDIDFWPEYFSSLISLLVEGYLRTQLFILLSQLFDFCIFLFNQFFVTNQQLVFSNLVYIQFFNLISQLFVFIYNRLIVLSQLFDFYRNYLLGMVLPFSFSISQLTTALLLWGKFAPVSLIIARSCSLITTWLQYLRQTPLSTCMVTKWTVRLQAV